jgi:hypothetical protein
MDVFTKFHDEDKVQTSRGATMALFSWFLVLVLFCSESYEFLVSKKEKGERKGGGGGGGGGGEDMGERRKGWWSYSSISQAGIFKVAMQTPDIPSLPPSLPSLRRPPRRSTWWWTLPWVKNSTSPST